MPVWKSFLGGLSDLLWPPRCLACNVFLQTPGPLCAVCTDTLVDIPSTQDQRFSFLRPPAWTSATCRFEFGGQLAVAVRKMKYQGVAASARQLGPLLCPVPAGCDLVLAVPLHPRRLRLRGFNQAAELARGARVPSAHGILVRTKNGPTQTDLPPSARLSNVAGAFFVRTPERVVDRRVLLIDDVMTTGATADACAEVLRKAGARRVDFMALARAQL